MPLVPYRFLFRLAFACRYFQKMPGPPGDRLLGLTEDYRINTFAGMEEERNFATFALAWNELGLGIQVEVRGKENPPLGDCSRPRTSDGFTLWLGTRGLQTGHRANRYCHQFNFLAAGFGPERDEPGFVPTRIHRALEDAPLPPAGSVPFGFQSRPGGYLLEAFLPAGILNGYDPEQYSQLSFFLNIRDDELGEQPLQLNPEFPFWEDPSLWCGLDLVKP